VAAPFEITDDLIAGENSKAKPWLDQDYEHLARVLRQKFELGMLDPGWSVIPSAPDGLASTAEEAAEEATDIDLDPPAQRALAWRFNRTGDGGDSTPKRTCGTCQRSVAWFQAGTLCFPEPS